MPVGYAAKILGRAWVCVKRADQRNDGESCYVQMGDGVIERVCSDGAGVA